MPLLLGLALALAVGPTAAFGAPERQVILVVLEDRSYGSFLGDPVLSDLTRTGGLGLMTTSGGANLASLTAVNLGAGSSASDAPAGPVPFTERRTGLRVRVAPYRASAGDAVPGLLGSTLSEERMGVAYVDPSSSAGHVAMLAAMDRDGRIRTALLRASLDAVGRPAERVARAELVVSPDLGLISTALERTRAEEVLVVVVGAGASQAMRDRGDIVAPIVLARGSPAELVSGEGRATGLTSSTTRRDGIVADVDVAPTILDFLGVPVPDRMDGSPIEPSGAPPTGLHARFVEHERAVGPLSLTALAFALISLIAGLVVVFGPRRPTPQATRTVTIAILASAALMVALVPAGMLPSSTAIAVVLALAVVTTLLCVIALRVGGGEPRTAVAVVAVAGLVVVALDGVLGWPSGITPMIGGSALDGERFFGLGNAYAGLVLAGAVLGAARLPMWPGVGLIAAASVFAGLPFLGADLGGSLTLAVAAALWFGLWRWSTLGWRTWALAAVVLLGALVLFTIADRFLPGGGTHLSEISGDGALGGLRTLLDRLAANVRTTSATPAAWLAVLGLPVWLAAALTRPARLRAMLDADPLWRAAVVVLAIGGIVGYLLNDTHGMAGVAFTFVSAAMLYPALVLLAQAPAEQAEAIPDVTEPADTITDVGVTELADEVPEADTEPDPDADANR